MHILVQSITGATCEITDAQTLSEIQSQIESQMGIPSEEQKLLLNGKLLTSESKIEDNSTISLVVALEGGAKGKNQWSSSGSSCFTVGWNYRIGRYSGGHRSFGI